MERAFPDAAVTDHESLIEVLQNHPGDRHVVAAAVRAGAALIVTSNLRDFRPLPSPIEAHHPDRFLCELADRAAPAMIEIVRRQAADLRRTPVTAATVLDRLASSAPRFVARMRAIG
jgi:hypothetical protein